MLSQSFNFIPFGPFGPSLPASPSIPAVPVNEYIEFGNDPINKLRTQPFKIVQ